LPFAKATALEHDLADATDQALATGGRMSAMQQTAVMSFDL
jgi:hypothetical protein